MTEEAKTEVKPPKQKTNWAKIGMLISTIAMAIVLLAFSAGYFKVAQDQYYISETMAYLTHQIDATNETIAGIKKSISDMQSSLQKSQDLSQQQERLVAEWREAQKGDLLKWQFAEAKYLVRLANDQIQFSHNIETAIALLKQADENLQAISDANLLDLRKAIASDIANLQSLPKIDITGLYLRITALNNQVNQLPVNEMPLANKAVTPNAVQDENQVWWKKGLQKSWESLRQIIVIRKIDVANSPLVLPDEKMFLYQNLHSQMESALWAVLNRNAEIYQTNLARILVWVQSYFQLNVTSTQSFIQNIEELRKVDLKFPSVNLTQTLQLFDDVANKAKEPAQPATQGAV